MFCNECGICVPENADFCPECGTKVRRRAETSAMLQCLAGTQKGKSFPVEGEIVIGSLQGQAHIVVQDAYVSRRHVSIRFNSVSNCFEVKDQSTNGTFLENGTRLQKNVVTSCQRGTVIQLGSASQQFKLV